MMRESPTVAQEVGVAKMEAEVKAEVKEETEVKSTVDARPPSNKMPNGESGEA